MLAVSYLTSDQLQKFDAWSTKKRKQLLKFHDNYVVSSTWPNTFNFSSVEHKAFDPVIHTNNFDKRKK